MGRKGDWSCKWLWGREQENFTKCGICEKRVHRIWDIGCRRKFGVDAGSGKRDNTVAVEGEGVGERCMEVENRAVSEIKVAPSFDRAIACAIYACYDKLAGSDKLQWHNC